MKNLCQHFVTFLPVLVIIILLLLLSCIVSAICDMFIVALFISLHLSLSHLLSSFNSWCTFCDIILNPAALLCIYISVCLGMQKVSHRLYLALSQSPHLSSPPNTVVIGLYRFFDTNSGSTVLFVVFFICLCLCNCCGEQFMGVMSFILPYIYYFFLFFVQ